MKSERSKVKSVFAFGPPFLFSPTCPSFLVLPRFCHSDRLFLLCSFTLLFLFCTLSCHSIRPPRHSEERLCLDEESISTLNFCEQLAVSFFSCTFLRKKVPKSLCTVKMAASVFGRSLSGHGRLTLFRTPAPGARSLDERNPAISTSAEQNPTIISSTYPSFCGALSLLSF